MEYSFDPRFLLIGILVLCAVIALIVCIIVLRTLRKRKADAPAVSSEPLPGGGGSYTMRISGMNCEHCRANAEAALNAFEGVTAQVDLKTETAHIRYDGYPDLELLDRLRKAVEEAGFTVTEIS